MKKISIIILALGMFFFSNINAQTKNNKAKTVKSQVTFSVKGMTCSGCVATVTKTLNNTEGVLKSNVNLKNSTAVVEFDKNKISIEKIESRFNKSPYKVKQKIEKKMKKNGNEK